MNDKVKISRKYKFNHPRKKTMSDCDDRDFIKSCFKMILFFLLALLCICFYVIIGSLSHG